MANTKTMTAPLAIIKVGGVPVGKMRNIRLTENIRRGKVQGIGSLNPSELPALEWDGQLNCSAYLIDFSTEIAKEALLRTVQTVDQFVDTILLQDNGITIDIMRKVLDQTLANGVKVPKLEVFASIKGCFITREGFDISESQISGRDADFEYITPVIFPQ
jgi:hypothetical protein